MNKYRLDRTGTPIENLTGKLPDQLISHVKGLGCFSVERLFSASVSSRVGKGLDKLASQYGTTHEAIHLACAEVLSKEEMVRLCGPIEDYATGCLE